jgi:hypothetical protein
MGDFPFMLSLVEAFIDTYLKNVEQNDSRKIYRAKTPRCKVKNSSISPNLACFASLRESSSFRFRDP